MNQHSESEEEIHSIPPEITEAATNSLPAKSKQRYEQAYKSFMEWRLKNHIDSFSETVLLDYFKQLSEKMKPSSLWATYSMLRLTLNIERTIDISKYGKLCGFLKRTSRGYKPTRPKTLTFQQIREFLFNAPDEDYLFIKVGMIFRVMGACCKRELVKIETSHVEDLERALLVHIPDTETKTERQFVIGGNYYKICKKYMELRPPDIEYITRFFLNYQRGKCTKQPIGANKFSTLTYQVATFLKLSNPGSYTGHCWRRFSTTGSLDSDGDMTALKRHKRWRPTSVTGDYIALFLNNKILHTNTEQTENHFESGWTVAQTEALIDEYRKYPILYDINSDDYLNPELRNQSLRKILEALEPLRLGVTEIEVVTQWNNLMVKYIHTQQQIENGDLNEEPQFYEKLGFLKEFIKPVVKNNNGVDPLASSVEIKEEIEERLTEADQSPCIERLGEQFLCSECEAKSAKDGTDIFADFVASQLKKIPSEEVRQDTILEIHNLLHRALRIK